MQLFKKRNKYSALQPVKKKEIPQGLWDKCKNCNEVVYRKLLKENLNVCPKCSFHNPIDAFQRIEQLTDKDTFRAMDENMESVDILKFEGVASYTDKLASNRAKSGLKDAIVCGTASLDGMAFALGVMDFRFLGASMGSVVGEKVARLTEAATKLRLPLVIVTASGGARMYEGMFSLMQMAKTSGALHRHKAEGLPYIVIMTHPTTAGVTASYASLGDLTIAEPKALIGFAGPRVIKDTTQAELPEGFQSSEFLLKKGMIDRIVQRRELRKELSLCLEYLGGALKGAKASRGGGKCKASGPKKEKTIKPESE